MHNLFSKHCPQFVYSKLLPHNTQVNTLDYYHIKLREEWMFTTPPVRRKGKFHLKVIYQNRWFSQTERKITPFRKNCCSVCIISAVNKNFLHSADCVSLRNFVQQFCNHFKLLHCAPHRNSTSFNTLRASQNNRSGYLFPFYAKIAPYISQ